MNTIRYAAMLCGLALLVEATSAQNCSCHYGKVPAKDKVESNGKPVIDPFPVMATVIKTTPPVETVFALERGMETDLGVYCWKDLVAVEVSFWATDPDMHICENGEKNDVGALLDRLPGNPARLEIKRVKPKGGKAQTNWFEKVGVILDFVEQWKVRWENPNHGGRYSLETTGMLEDKWYDHSESDDAWNLDVDGYMAGLNLVKVDIEQIVTNVCSKTTNVTLSLTTDSYPPESVKWISDPPGISGSGPSVSADPSKLTPASYVVTAYSTLLPTCSDTATVNVLKIDIRQPATNVCWKMTNAVLTLTDDSYWGPGSVQWKSEPAGLSMISSSNTNFVFSPTNSIPGEYVVTAWSSLLPECTDTCTVRILKVEIKRDEAGGTVDYQPLTAATRTVLPGQKMNFKVEVLPAGLTVTDWAWTLPGITFKNYEANQTTGTLTPMAAGDLDDQTVHFYWANTGDDREVKCKVKIGGQWFVCGEELFQVKKPTCTLMTTLGTAGINATGTALGLFPDADSPRGITYTGNVQVPTGFTPGEWNFVQLVTPARHQTLNNGTNQHIIINGSTVIDTTYPYEPPPYTTHPGTAGSWATGPTSHTEGDDPGLGLDLTVTNRSVNNEAFTTYLMFLPPGMDSRYVPLQCVNWTWKGAATRGAGGWILDAGSAGQSVSASAETSAHPTWTSNVTSGGFTWVND